MIHERAPIRVCVVIVSYNTRDLLLDCIAHATRQVLDGVTQEIVVVDNASRDGSVEAVRERFPRVRVIANDRNAGFAAANNEAIRNSDGDYVLLLNSDALLAGNAVEALVRFMERNRDVGLAGCRLLNPDGSLQQSCFRYATLWRTIGDALLLTNALQFLPWIDDYRRWPHDRVRPVSSLSGACMIARREAIAQVGLLDERFFMYAEDNDWCRRFRRAGWKVVFTPDTHAVPLGGGSQSGHNARSLALAEESHSRYMRKYYGPLGCAIWSQTALAGSLLRLALHLALRRPERRRRGSGAMHHTARIAWHASYWRRAITSVATGEAGA